MRIADKSTHYVEKNTSTVRQRTERAGFDRYCLLGERWIAKEKCDDKSGNDKKACVTAAKDAETLAKMPADRRSTRNRYEEAMNTPRFRLIDCRSPIHRVYSHPV